MTVFKDLSYFSADRGLELVASEFSLATGSWVRESIYIYIYIMLERWVLYVFGRF